jgi:signal transduction histidine kinase
MTADSSTSSINPLNSEFELESEEHAEWIKGESIRAFMPTQQQTQTIALLVIPIVVAVLYGHVNMLALTIWAALSALLAIYRWRLTSSYTKHLIGSSTLSQIQFQKKNYWTWPSTAFLWSSLVYLFFGKAPLFNQLVCFVVLASIGVFSATGYATHYKIMKLFINTMMLNLLLGMSWVYLTNTEAAKNSIFGMIFPLQIVFWKLLFLIGSRLNKSHLQGLQLRKGNQDLIISLQQQTNRANQAIETKNRFLASAAHDIRQPVLALDVYASMLRAEPQLASELTEKIEIATKSVIEMFDSLFDLSRLDSGQLKIKNNSFDAVTLMHNLEVQYKPAAQSKQLELRIRCCDIKIYTDQQLLKRILGNLLMNAIKFTHIGGVLIACRQTSKGVRFEVWDTGIGIAANEQTAVVGEFYKSPSHLGTSEGFGLGLSIVTRLSESLGFHFSMKSKLGVGSAFFIDIPHGSNMPKEAINPADAHKK